MGDRRPFGFARVGLRDRLVPLFLLPFVAIGLGLGAWIFDSWRELHAVATYEKHVYTAPGRVRVSGKVTRDRLVTSPLGKTGVGWVGEVGSLTKDSDGDISFDPVCVRADLSQLHLEGWSMTFARPTDAVVLGSRSKLRHALPIVDLGDPVEPSSPAAIPDAMRAACGTLPTQELSYRELVLQPESVIEVLGCGTGQSIARCDDGGPYVLTNSGVSMLLAKTRSDVGFVMVFGALWNLVIIGVIGLWASSKLVRATPTFQEKLQSR